MNFTIQNRLIKELSADPIQENYVRQVAGSAFSYVVPKVPSNPKLVHASQETAQLIGLTENDTQSEAFLDLVSGRKVWKNTKPFALAYSGHQFGNWAGQLGDGRAINLFEVEHHSRYYTIQLKGAGKTPYSRRADGLAVLRSSIREHLCSEAMFHLGIPTTRSLSLITTGDDVLRDMLYNGNAAYEKGAIVCRIAPSFIRFGNFELFASQNDIENLKKLADFVIRYYYPDISALLNDREKYIQFFKQVSEKTLEMVLHWQRVGFVHGVMNTDNMSIHGLTIDYGPYGWQDDYNPGWTPNTTDSENRRYRFGNQPNIALWNLLRLANALYPLIEEAKPLEEILEAFSSDFEQQYLEMLLGKIGIQQQNESSPKLINQLFENLALSETDMTIFYRLLADISKTETPKTAFKKIENAFYTLSEIQGKIKEKWLEWFTFYLEYLQKETLSDHERSQAMNSVNPKYVLRNYMAQIAIEKAEKEDYSVLEELYEMLKKPYQEQPQYEKWFAKRPDWAKVKVGCSTLSCSS